MVAWYAARIGGPLYPQRVPLPGGSSLHLPGVDPDGRLFVAASPYVAALSPDDLPDVARRIFTTSLLTSTHSSAEVVMLFAGEPARDSALAWVRRYHGHHIIRMEVADLGPEWTEALQHAMVAPVRTSTPKQTRRRRRPEPDRRRAG